MAVATRRRGAIAFFVTSCACLVALALALNVGWVVMNWREVVPLLLGVPVFAAIITGLILNTTFLVREIRRNEQHNAFVNAVTHELKTPVTSIRLYLETLKSRGTAIDDAQRLAMYDVMLEDNDRLLHTIEQVLRAARTGGAALHKTRLDLRALTEECVKAIRRQPQVTEQSIRMMPSDEAALEVMGDAGELRASILNLLGNAVKFSGDQVQIEVSVARVRSHALVSVRDHGPGLAADELRRVFKRFYRVRGPLTQRVKGTGLGLFIVDSTARQHGGRAFAASDGEGHGATFSIELPLAPPATES